MPPSRLLPPQFLLPAWTSSQLQHVQRAYKSGSANLRRKKERIREQQSALSRPESQGLSLFEELFPEEKKAAGQRKERDDIHDSGFPSLEDVESVSESFPRRNGIDTWRTALNIPSVESWLDFPAYQDPLLEGAEVDSVRSADRKATQRRHETSVLVLSNASTSLLESDFLRISLKGAHIQGWASGIIKVIPGRDPQTLEPQGHYFILFSTDAAAQAYRHQLKRLHFVLRAYNNSSVLSSLQPPPGFIKDGEDIHALIQAYTVIPASQKGVTARILERPLRPSLKRLIKDGGYPEIIPSDNILENKVLFSLDKGSPTIYALRAMLSKDQKERNLQWKLSGGINEIIKLGESKMEVPQDDDGNTLEDGHESKNRRTQPVKWVLTFKDSQEARRFVRSWHQRPVQSLQDRLPDGEPSPRARAILLW